MSRALAIVNTASGHYDPETVNAAIRRAASEGERKLEFHEVSEGESVAGIVRSALEAGVELFVAVGGDGTVSGVVEGLNGAPAPVAVVPAGTGNLLARDLGLPLDPVEAAKLISGDHDIRTLDAMRVGDRTFILNVGVGISSATVRDTRNEDKRRFGRAAYVGTGLRELFGVRPCVFTVTVDGRDTLLRATEVTVANCDFIGDLPWPWAPDIVPDDGKLDVCLVLVPTAAESIRSGWRVLRHRRKLLPNVRWLRARRSVRIESTRTLPAQGDGDIIGETPIEVTVIPDAVRVIVPRRDRATS
jgi:YegS/Rv2252/BmrU family lipid kinase